MKSVNHKNKIEAKIYTTPNGNKILYIPSTEDLYIGLDDVTVSVLERDLPLIDKRIINGTIFLSFDHLAMHPDTDITEHYKKIQRLFYEVAYIGN